MPTLTMTKGLPASGKSTAAIRLVEGRPPGEVVRVNKDLLRTMMHADRFGKRRTENQILAVRDFIVTHHLTASVDVIVDDTNLAPYHETRLRQLAAEHGAQFEVLDFTDVPLDVCIERDIARAKSVGPKVIRKMWNQFLAPRWEEAVPDPALPWAVVVDLDGTLAHFTSRSPYDHTRVEEDLVDTVVRDLVAETVTRGDTVLVVSGRKEAARPGTERWLTAHGVVHHQMWMRADGDNRDDTVVKEEIFDHHIEGRFNVRFVLDDRNKVVHMWRRRGLKVLQVADGDF